MRSLRWVSQAWGVLEAKAGNVQLARQLYKCAVRADPSSEAAWLVRSSSSRPGLADWGMRTASNARSAGLG